jgi:hypothetical protein
MGKICTTFDIRKREKMLLKYRHRWKDSSAMGLGKIYSENVNCIQTVSFCESIDEPLIYLNADIS